MLNSIFKTKIIEALPGVEQCLKLIEANAGTADYAQHKAEQEFSWLRGCGALKAVLPGESLDFNKPNSAELLNLLKLVGKSNLSIGRVFEGHINALYLIHLYASESQKQYWYKKVISEDGILGVWNTQADNGILCQNSRNDQLTIDGMKTFCSGAAIVTHALITGNIDLPDRKGWQMMVLNMSKISGDNIDLTSWETLGMKASGSFTVDFTGYQVSEFELLGMPADYLIQPHFNGGAIRFAAVQLGGAEAIAQHTLAYLTAMGRAEDPLQKMRLAAIMTDITTGNLWISQAGKNFDDWVSNPEKVSELIAFANMTRTVVEEIGIRVMNDSNRCVGARGLMAALPLERLHRDLTFYLRQPAPDATRAAVAEYFINNIKADNAQ